MPRTEIELPYHIDYISVLDENGELDKGLEPDIPDDELLKIHRYMFLGRLFDAQILSLQRQGRIGTFAPTKGQEASQLGAVSIMRDSDWFVPSFREAVAFLWRGATMEGILLAYAGFSEGNKIPEGQNNLPVAVPVGSQTLHAVGIAYGMKYRKKDDLAMVFFGDGATSEGDFHEALNFAGVFQLPVIFVCQNNHWAISVPRKNQTRAQTLAQKALAYGIPGVQVDGNDALAVRVAAQEAEKRARSGEGPTLIECVTYRMSVHTTADDPKRYRTDEEVGEWAKRDPLERFQKYLKTKKLLTDKKIASLEEELKAEIQESVKAAEKKMKELGDPMDMFSHVMADTPPALEAQKEELARDLKDSAREADNG